MKKGYMRNTTKTDTYKGKAYKTHPKAPVHEHSAPKAKFR
ncbi:hypothetical protein HHE02_08510 [Helicobacter heilmannii]|nr:hypothetical protein HHE02_08510 [Helicobacter heilmannii]